MLLYITKTKESFENDLKPVYIYSILQYRVCALKLDHIFVLKHLVTVSVHHDSGYTPLFWQLSVPNFHCIHCIQLIYVFLSGEEDP